MVILLWHPMRSVSQRAPPRAISAPFSTIRVCLFSLLSFHLFIFKLIQKRKSKQISLSKNYAFVVIRPLTTGLFPQSLVISVILIYICRKRREYRTPSWIGELSDGTTSPRGGPRQGRLYDPYWSAKDVSRGLELMVLHEGVLRFNPQNHKEAFVALDGFQYVSLITVIS